MYVGGSAMVTMAGCNVSGNHAFDAALYSFDLQRAIVRDPVGAAATFSTVHLRDTNRLPLHCEVCFVTGAQGCEPQTSVLLEYFFETSVQAPNELGAGNLGSQVAAQAGRLGAEFFGKALAFDVQVDADSEDRKIDTRGLGARLHQDAAGLEAAELDVVRPFDRDVRRVADLLGNCLRDRHCGCRDQGRGLCGVELGPQHDGAV